jgi:hypothetical protein
MTRGKLVAATQEQVGKVTAAPEEPSQGQDDPPELGPLVLATIRLLSDLDETARQRDGQLSQDEGLRIMALLTAARRFRKAQGL